MKVREIFRSIQGEGVYMGINVVFIRLAGCNLRCPWCDTKDTWNTYGSVEMPIEEIVSKVNDIAVAGDTAINRVVITGGEPTVQLEELRLLIAALHKEGYIIAMETNGTFYDTDSLDLDWVTCSPKRSSSWRVPDRVDELKYVVDDKFDASVIAENIRARYSERIWLQPCDCATARETMACVAKAVSIVQKDARLRLGIQLHKFAGVR